MADSRHQISGGRPHP